MTDESEKAVPVKNEKTKFRTGGGIHDLSYDQHADFGNTHVAFDTATRRALIYVDNGDHKQFTDGDKVALTIAAGTILINGERKNYVGRWDGIVDIGDKRGRMTSVLTREVFKAFADGVVTVQEQRDLTDFATQLVNKELPKEPRGR